jgi:hypothetical protein
MEGNDNDNWISKYGTWVSFILWVLTFLYYGVYEGTTLKNKVAALETKDIEKSVRIDGIEKDKVSKETFVLIMTGVVEIKASIEKTNNLLLDHILKGK